MCEIRREMGEGINQKLEASGLGVVGGFERRV
jgi:hypothetical protein